jgi:hypothetical protein
LFKLACFILVVGYLLAAQMMKPLVEKHVFFPGIIFEETNYISEGPEKEVWGLSHQITATPSDANAHCTAAAFSIRGLAPIERATQTHQTKQQSGEVADASL